MEPTNSNEKLLKHWGVKGMRWGVRRSPAELARGSSGPKEPQAFVDKKTGKVNLKKTRGGENFPPSDDAKRAVRLGVIAAKSGTQALSNKELQDLNNRIQLEQKYTQLVPKNPSTIRRGQDFTKEVLKLGATVNDVITFTNSPAGLKLRGIDTVAKKK